MQYEVPQFIEHEAKILGPLTLRQSIYVSVAGGIIFLMRVSKVDPLIFWLSSPAILGFAAALAWAKPGGRPFTVFLGNMLKFITMPKVFVWKQKLPEQKYEIPKIEVLEKPIYVNPEEKTMEQGESRLRKLGRKIDLGA